MIKTKKFGFPIALAGSLLLLKNNEDSYYFLLGMRRGFRSIMTGAQIIINYKIKGVDLNSHEYAAKKLYELFKKNSGAYIKFGQSISQMEHILPQPFIKNLEPLCQEAPSTSFKMVKEVLEKDLKKKFEDIFESFEEKPIGCASLAQVHRGKLKESKEEVAVKIQHPMVSTYCSSDVAIVKFATKIGEKLISGVKLQWIAKEFERNIMNEINFTNEGLNADKIRKFFKEDIKIVIPLIKWEYTTKRVLTMSFEEGKSIVDTEFRRKNNISVNEIAELLANVFNKQIFKFGFVHSDPHHGNLFIRKEKINGQNITRLVLLDHGLYRELDKEFKQNYSLLWRGIFIQDANLIKQACKGLNVTKPELFISVVTNRKYQENMNKENKYDTKGRIGVKNNSSFENEQIKEFISQNFINITSTLNEMRSEMILVLKINSFLRSIDKRIGNPINNFNVMINYVYSNFLLEEMSLREKFYILMEFYKFKCLIFFINIYYLFSGKILCSKDYEKANLEFSM